MIECYTIVTENTVAGIGLMLGTSGKMRVVVASPEVQDDLYGKTLDEVLSVCARKGWQGRKVSMPIMYQAMEKGRRK